MNSASPKVSVGMPVYNGGRYLAPAIESVLGQSFRDFELVISDNASTDGSYEICQQYARQDPRIRLVRQATNIGALPNYRWVAQAARADYFKWASANDLIHEDFLQQCVATLDARPDCILCYPRTRIMQETVADAVDYEDGLDLQNDDPIARFVTVTNRLRLNNVMNGLMRRDALLRADIMPDFVAGDMYLIAELSLSGKFIEIPRPLFYRRVTADSATKLRSEQDVLIHHHRRTGARALFQNWRQCVAVSCTMLRARLSARDKARALNLAARTWIWRRRELLRDAADALRLLLHSARLRLRPR